ncbi:MAG: NAD(P)H-hydrate epimerase [Phycisphaerales bacterium]
MKPLTREQVRAVDRLAIKELGIPGVVLMENAGRNAVEIILRFMKERGGGPGSALILCGGGNNGGDGFVSARHLHNQGVRVRIIAHKPVDQLTGDAAINARICEKMSLDIQPASVLNAHTSAPSLIIDALLGTGFTGGLRPDMLELIQHINAQRDQPDPPIIVAIDLPSGLDCDTGRPAQAAVIADLTVTFVAPKLGFSQPAAWPYLGKFEVADIGVPPELIRRAANG